MSIAVHFSDASDSELAASIIRSHRQRVPSTRQSTHQSTNQSMPGVRRIRRLLNARLSDSDTITDYDSYASASDWEEDINQPIVEFNWQAKFIEVGSEFYQSSQADRSINQSTSQPTLTKDRVLHRVKKLEHDRAERRAERQERRKRREERALELQNNLERGSLHSIRTARESMSGTDQSINMSAPSSPSHQSTNEHGANEDVNDDERVYGQELSASLWTLIDRPTRSLLRKMDDFQFMNELESLIDCFKSGEKWSGSADNFRVINQSTDAVELQFVDGFVRALAEGSLPFHLLHHSKQPVNQPINQSKSSSSRLRLCIVKRRGYFVHHASLARHIQTYYLHTVE